MSIGLGVFASIIIQDRFLEPTRIVAIYYRYIYEKIVDHQVYERYEKCEKYEPKVIQKYESEIIQEYESNRTIDEAKAEILYFLGYFDDVSVYFENIETGFTMQYNENYVYFSASVTKAPLALFVYTLARDGQVDLDYKITFLREDYRGGSGIIHSRYAFGHEFTIRRLVALNLYESDNTATAMLMRYFGNGYRQFLVTIGADHRMAHRNLTDSGLNAIQAGIFARSIYDFIAEGNVYSEEFKRNLLNNQEPFIISHHYPVASKTGWTRYIAWHDMAIIYAPSPYILTILSARAGWTPADYRDFYEISMKFERFNNYWFGQ